MQYVNNQSDIAQNVFVGDKLLAFDEVDYSVMNPMDAYRDACQKLNSVRVITISRRQPM